jgi:hypothetical protein
VKTIGDGCKLECGGMRRKGRYRDTFKRTPVRATI